MIPVRVAQRMAYLFLLVAPVMIAIAAGANMIAAQPASTPPAGIEDPCSALPAATPAPATPVSTSEVSAGDAAIAAITAHQRNVVTTLEVIIAYSDNAELVRFASEVVPDARATLDDLNALVTTPAGDDPAAVLGVLDRIRREQALPADQGSLDLYRRDYQLSVVCQPGIDLKAVTVDALVSNDLEIIELATIAQFVVTDEDALTVIHLASDASTDRIDHLTTPGSGATPAS